MEIGGGSESTLVHSPGAHYHSQATNNNNMSSSSSSSSAESEVSDMVVENPSRFEGLSKQRKKSGGSDYRPQSASASNSMSESESESASISGSCSEQSTPVSQKKALSNARLSDDSEATSSRSVSITPVPGSRLKNSPIFRKSPLNVARRSVPSEVTAMRGYRYSMLPSRSAATNVSYSRYLDEEESDSDYAGFRNRKRGKKRDSSDSEFEVGGRGVQSASEELSISDDDISEDEYRPPKRKTRGGGRQKERDWGGSESDSDYRPGAGKRRGKGGARKTARRKNDGYTHSFLSDGGSSASSSESEFEPGYVSKKRRKKKRRKGANSNADISPSDFVRTTGRSKGVVSYKDFYDSDADEAGDGEDGGDGEGGVAEGEGATEYVAVEDNREGIEKILKKRIGRVGDTGNQTTCYARCVEAGSNPTILAGVAQGDKDCIARLTFSFTSPPLAAGEPSEVQYLVKWLNWSHLHNTWETEASLESKDVKGMKKFHNFLKREEERELWEASASLEDIEYLKCQEELSDQLLINFTQVERVVAAKAGEGSEKEYLCKWRGLPYSECTWEDSALLSNWFQEDIDSYIERNASDRIPNKNAKVLRHRPKFVFMKEQLRSLGGQNEGLKLRDYQLEGVNWLVKSWCKDNSVILADEMGLGKTIQCIAFLHCLFHNHQLYGPYIIVVPLSTLPAWQREFELWAPEMSTVIYIGDVHSRNKIREFEWCHENRKLKFNSIVTTYEILLKDKDFLGSVAWTALIVDEAHRLKNDDSLLYRTLMEFRTNYRLLITGTPLQNSLKELWSLLHFIMEKKFPNWEDFEYDNQAYGEGDATCLTSIHQELQPFLLRRMKKDVEKSLPAKVEQILRVEMSSVQKQYYRWILSKNYKALSKGVKGSITGFMNIMMELKKCCNHVWIVRSPDEKEEKEKDQLQTLIRGSGKLYLLDKLLVRLNKSGHRVLIFSQMVRMLDVLADYMRLRRFHFQRLDGSIRGDDRKDAIDHFNAEGSQDFCFLLSTRAGGLGVNLATADTVVIFDSDWNPQNDLQAQARAHRIGQKKQVNIYRLVTKNSIEEDIIERAKKKMVLDHLVIQRMDTTGRTVLSTNKEPSKSVPFDKEELNAILKFGTEDLFKSDSEASGDKALQEMDIDDILQRAEMQATAEDSSHSDLLSQFKVASFAMDEDELAPPPSATPTEGKTFLLSPRGRGQAPVEKSWEELIPKDAREKMDEEERTREQMDLYLPPRQRKVRNYCEDQSQGNSKTRSGRSVAPPMKGSPEVCATTVMKNVRGFTDAEIRRFVKSYRKFINPKARLEAIAADAELQEKSMTELQRLMAVLHDGCVQAEEEHAASIEADPGYDPKKDKGASLRLCGVTIGSGNLLRREDELAALACVLPANPAVRKKYRMLSHPKAVNWSGVKWTAVDDAKFLIGIYEHGLGNWESIRDDPNLGLSNKILRPDTSLKPQASHLQTRAEYLLKLLQVEASQKKRKTKKTQRYVPNSRSPAKKQSQNVPRTRIPKTSSSNLMVHVSRDLLDDSDSGTASRRKRKGGATTAKSHLARKKPHLRDEVTSRARSSPRRKERVFIPGERSSPRTRKGRSDVDKRAESGVKGVVVHGEDGDDMEESGVELDDDTFQKCKVMMKPMKKAMLELREPTEEEAQRDPAAVDHFKKVLVEIGDHITSTLTVDHKMEDTALWKTNLWVFVSVFTASGPLKLRKIYKKTKKSAAGETSKVHNNSTVPRPPKGSEAPPSVPHPPKGSEEPPSVPRPPKESEESPSAPRPPKVSEESPSLPRPHSHGKGSEALPRTHGADQRPETSNSKDKPHSSTKSADHAVNPASSQHMYRPSSHSSEANRERHRHPSDHSHSSETGHRYEEEMRHRERSHHHHHSDRHRHSSGSSHHSDGGSSSKRPRYHSPPPHHSGSSHRHNSHSHH